MAQNLPTDSYYQCIRDYAFSKRCPAPNKNTINAFNDLAGGISMGGNKIDSKPNTTEGRYRNIHLPYQAQPMT